MESILKTKNLKDNNGVTKEKTQIKIDKKSKSKKTEKIQKAV